MSTSRRAAGRQIKPRLVVAYVTSRNNPDGQKIGSLSPGEKKWEYLDERAVRIRRFITGTPCDIESSGEHSEGFGEGNQSGKKLNITSRGESENRARAIVLSAQNFGLLSTAYLNIVLLEIFTLFLLFTSKIYLFFFHFVIFFYFSIFIFILFYGLSLIVCFSAT